MKIGIFGLGSIGLRHARNLQALGHKVLGYDIDEKKQKAFQGRTYPTLNSFEGENVDAYIIATPTDHHYQCVRDCVVVKPTFVEKPLVALKDFNSVILLRDPGSFYEASVGYMLRFHPCVKAARAWLSQGHIGEPIWAQFTCGQFNDKPDYLRDGVVLNWSHEIDLALYLFGPAKVATASVRVTDGKDDIADFVLQHDNGARSTIHLDYVTKNEIRECWLIGSEKNIGMDLLGRRNSMGKIIQEFGGDWNADYIDEIESFVKSIEVSGTKYEPAFKLASPMATGEDGLRVLEICAEIKKIAGIA